jgi:hypothetical protein
MTPPNRHLHKMNDSFVVPEGNEFSDEFFERDLPPGVDEVKKILSKINEHFHEDYALSFTKHVAEFLDRMYFRSVNIDYSNAGFAKALARNPDKAAYMYLSRVGCPFCRRRTLSDYLWRWRLNRHTVER